MPLAPSARDDFRRVVAASARQNGDFSPRHIDRNFNHAHVLFIGERRAFTGGAARNEEVDAGVNLALDERAQGAFTDGPVESEWGNERCASSSKHETPSYGR